MGIKWTVLDRNNAGKWVEVLARATFTANDYVQGGYSVVPGDVGLGMIYSAWNVGAYGTTNAQVKFSLNTNGAPFFSPNGTTLLALRDEAAASIIVEESVTITSNAGQLANAPGYVISVNASAGTTTGAANLVPAAATLATHQCNVNFSTGAIKFFSTDAVTTALVTYIPMGIGPFIASNQVVDEAVTLSSSGVNLANQASLIQYLYDTTLGTVQHLIGNQSSPAVATNQSKVNFRNSTHTTLTCAAGNTTDSALCTYWKSANIGLAQGFVAETSIATSSNVLTVTSPSIIIPTFGTQVAAVTTVPAIVNEALLGPSGTAAAGNPVYNPFANTITFASGDAITNVYFSYIALNDLTFAYSNEFGTGTNFSGLQPLMRFFGSK
jgi:hypothetical protein